MKKKLISFAFVLIANINLNAQFNLAWAKSIGGTWNQVGTHIATDANGNIYTVGTFSDTSNLDPSGGTQTVTPINWDDIYVVKQTSSGNLVWAKSIGGTGLDSPAGIGIDTTGNVYVSGNFDGVIDLDPSVTSNTFQANSKDFFITKLDANGNFVWGKSMGSTQDDEIVSMRIDVLGNIYITGTFKGTMDFDPGPGSFMLTPEGSWASDIFVNKLDANGNFVWAAKMGGTGTDEPKCLCFDALSNVYITGGFNGVADFDPSASSYTLSSLDGTDAFICKLNNSGGFLWAAQFGGTQWQAGYSVVADNNNVYIAGEFANTVDFDPGNGTYNISNPPNALSNFAVKLSNIGNFIWAKAIIAVPGNPTAASNIDLDPNGNFYWTGRFYNTLDFDPGPGTYNLTANGNDTYLVILNPNGSFINATAFPYYWNSFVLNATAEVMITGWYYNSDFDPSIAVYNMTSTGASDACIVKLGQAPNSVNENIGNGYESNIYPNPNTGKFELNVPVGSQVKIVNSVGHTVSEFIMINETQALNLSNCKGGIYFLMIDINGKQVTKKFIIEN